MIIVMMVLVTCHSGKTEQPARKVANIAKNLKRNACAQSATFIYVVRARKTALLITTQNDAFVTTKFVCRLQYNH